jgi:alpha-L-rhamnosidase
MTSTAGLLGLLQDQSRYADSAAHYRKVWRRRFGGPNGLLSSDTVTAYALAVCFQLLNTPEENDAAGARIAELCSEAGHRISTGFVGTPLVCDALTATGQLETAYRMLLQTGPPSWLYPVTQGATTIWERWDSLMPDGRVNPSEMTSFNHYALGAVVDWLHRCVGGLSPLEPGYRSVLVRPLPCGGITSAATRFDSPYGETSVSWRLDGTTFSSDVSVPVGVTAQVVCPLGGWQRRRGTSGTHTFSGSFDLEAAAPRRGTPRGTPWQVAGMTAPAGDEW